MFCEILLVHCLVYALVECQLTVNPVQTNLTVSPLEANLTGVIKVCKTRRSICHKGGSPVCAARRLKDDNEYKTFENTCLLFLENNCYYFYNQYYIISGGTCIRYLSARRKNLKRNDYEDNGTPTGSDYEHGSNIHETTTQQHTDTDVQYIPVTGAYDHHRCPNYCTDAYDPRCVSVNRKKGLHFKLFQFMNHCMADKYYCENVDEFDPVPNEKEDVQDSKLDLPFCGANRFVQFAKFAEVASSMGHYGWLIGNEKYNRIVPAAQGVYDGLYLTRDLIMKNRGLG